MIATATFGMAFVVFTIVTFVVWIRPPATEKSREYYPLFAAIMGAVFFLACFGLGVWVSIFRVQGGVWLP